MCGCLIEPLRGWSALARRTDRVITVDEVLQAPSGVRPGAPHHLRVTLTVRALPSVPGSSGVASAADAVVGVTMTSSRFIDR